VSNQRDWCIGVCDILSHGYWIELIRQFSLLGNGLSSELTRFSSKDSMENLRGVSIPISSTPMEYSGGTPLLFL
jgi:hypothetical protein